MNTETTMIVTMFPYCKFINRIESQSINNDYHFCCSSLGYRFRLRRHGPRLARGACLHLEHRQTGNATYFWVTCCCPNYDVLKNCPNDVFWHIAHFFGCATIVRMTICRITMCRNVVLTTCNKRQSTEEMDEQRFASGSEHRATLPGLRYYDVLDNRHLTLCWRQILCWHIVICHIVILTIAMHTYF